MASSDTDGVDELRLACACAICGILPMVCGIKCIMLARAPGALGAREDSEWVWTGVLQLGRVCWGPQKK